MTEVSRRSVMGAAWSLPVVALAVAAPAAAASTGGELRITNIAPRGFGDRTDLFWTVSGVPDGQQYIVMMEWTPQEGSTIGPRFAVATGPSSSTFILIGLVPGTQYTFTLQYYLNGTPVFGDTRVYTA